jgi:ATP-dependent phosphoenolpyruvate carboxykinase
MWRERTTSYFFRMFRVKIKYNSFYFRQPFIVWHPAKYATMLAERIHKHQADAWLVNTGWIGGSYGVGKRISLAYTRAILDAIHSGELAKSGFEEFPVFKLHIPTSCPGVPNEILHPEKSWKDKDFNKTILKLGNLFIENFESYADRAGENVLRAGPTIS